MSKPIKTPRKVSDVRYENFIFLLEKFVDENPGPWPVMRFAKRIGKTSNYVTQLKSKEKTIGPQTSTRIEIALGLPCGWMDESHDELQPRDAAESSFSRRMLRWYRRHSMQEQEVIIDTLEQFLGSMSLKKPKK